MDERIFPLINDYKINLLNPLEITDFSMFETGLRPLFEVLKNASDERKLNALITTDDIFKRVDVETIAAMNLFAGTDIEYEEKEEVINVCKAWENHYEAVGRADADLFSFFLLYGSKYGNNAPGTGYCL